MNVSPEIEVVYIVFSRHYNINNMAAAYYDVILKPWVDPEWLYVSSIIENSNPDALKFIISISEFTKNNAYYKWRGIIFPWCFDMWDVISANPDPEAIAILEKYPQHINWRRLSINTSPRAIKLLLKNPGKISWTNFSINPAPEAVKYLIQNPDKIDWLYFSLNTSPVALAFLRDYHYNKIEWWYLVSNTSKEAIEMITKSPETDEWYHCPEILKNPAAIDALRTKIDILANHDDDMRYYLYRNPNPDVYHLIKQIPNEEINLVYLSHYHPKTYLKYYGGGATVADRDVIRYNSACPDIIDLIELDQYEAFCDDFSKNPALFDYVYDYNKIKHDRAPLNEALMAWFWHPTRVQTWIEHDINVEDL